jgi:hypothetical protein
MSQEDDFLKFVRRQCKKLNIKFRIGNGYTVITPDGSVCDGYFLEPHRHHQGELAIAKKCSNFYLTLAHEYCHMLQWFEEDPLYRDGEYYTLEKKTERQALKLLKEWNLPTGIAMRQSKDYLKWLKENRNADL